MSLPVDKETLVQQIRESRDEYNYFIRRFNFQLELISAHKKNQDNDIADANFWAHCLFEWCENINSIVAFQYQRGLKEKVLEWLEEMRLKDGSDLYEYTSEREWRLLVNHATMAVEAIWDIPFIEHIALV